MINNKYRVLRRSLYTFIKERFPVEYSDWKTCLIEYCLSDRFVLRRFPMSGQMGWRIIYSNDGTMSTLYLSDRKDLQMTEAEYTQRWYHRDPGQTFIQQAHERILQMTILRNPINHCI